MAPTSIDPDRSIAGVAAADPGRRAVGRQARRLVVALDRPDRSSGILERLRAYEMAFAHGEIDPGEIDIVELTTCGVGARTRPATDAVEIERRTFAVNSTWQRADRSVPIELRPEPIARAEALALAATADIAIVTHGPHGDDRIAKEFSILAEAYGGALVLSDRTSVAAELGPDSVLVDGHDPASIARGLATALRSTEAERRGAAQRRMRTVRSWTARDWATTVHDALAMTRQDRVTTSSHPSPSIGPTGAVDGPSERSSVTG